MENRESSVIPEASAFTYRKILYVDLIQDRCTILKSDPEGWQPGEGSLSGQLAQFAQSGAIHPEDQERFLAFTSLEHMRGARNQQTLTLVYRRREESGWRWNLMEFIPDQEGAQAVLSVKDVNDVLQEGLERGGFTFRGQDLIRSLGERNCNIYTIDLTTGQADSIRVDNQMCDDLAPAPWDEVACAHILSRLREAYQEEFQLRFSLEGLRRAEAEGQEKTELLCQWQQGMEYRYISITAFFSQVVKAKRYTVVALQDVDEHVRRELDHSQRDAQMAAILRSRFRTMVTVDLTSGQCQRTNLARSAGLEDVQTGDYTLFLQNALSNRVHPDDAEAIWTTLSLEHLRQTAAAMEGDYKEENCLCRLLGGETRWLEQRIIYSRQNGHVAVNILGQDITSEKQREETRLQALEDRSYIISSLSTLFFSTYYIDLEQDTFRAVTQLRRVGDLLGEEIHCTTALQIYANHFIHPDDREEYLRVMGLDNLRRTLRWWQPYTAVEFRKLPDDPNAAPERWEWVRATAVLSRTGPDDLPRTAVYVAQDITEGQRRPGPDCLT